MFKVYTEYLRHILDECDFILRTTGELDELSELLKDEILKKAIERSLSIIGEASKKIPVDIKLKWSSIEWKSIAGMRDKLVHVYSGISYRVVWDVIKEKIPKLKIQIEEVLQNN